MLKLITKPLLKKMRVGMNDLDDMSEKEINAIPMRDLKYFYDSKADAMFIGHVVLFSILLLAGVFAMVKAVLLSTYTMDYLLTLNPEDLLDLAYNYLLEVDKIIYILLTIIAVLVYFLCAATKRYLVIHSESIAMREALFETFKE